MKKLFALGALAFLITSCETSDDNNLEAARSCLDNASKTANSSPATAATAAAVCDTMVANMTTPEAAKIGFGAVLLIQQKFSQIPALADALKASSNTLNSSISFMIFSPVSTSNADVTKMVNYANRSGSAGLQKIAMIVQTSNLVAGLGGLSSTPTTAQVNTAVAGLTAANANTPGTPEYQLAQSLISTQQSVCAGSGATSSTCTKMTSAIGSTPTNYASVITSFQAFVAAGG